MEKQYKLANVPVHMDLRIRLCFSPSLRKMQSAKLFFVVSCASAGLFFLWAHIVKYNIDPMANEGLLQDVLHDVGNDLRYIDVYLKKPHPAKDQKYILLWTRNDFSPFSFMEVGQRTFIKNNCTFINCYVTTNKRFFGNKYTNFHAIAINGRNMISNLLPRIRSPYQKFIYFNMESSVNYPVCSDKYDDFFNLTATYRLDSDIPMSYIQFRNKGGEIMGPKSNIKWIDDVLTNDEYFYKIKDKTYAVAWFVSNCDAPSRRDQFARKLKNALLPYGHKLHIYGRCGDLECSSNKSSSHSCELMLQRDYYFYLAFENSMDKDYVTEKVLTALKNNVVPIVLGGADYSRFLPPNSYINALKQNIYELAATIDRLIHTPKEYIQYFAWKKHYTVHDPQKTDNICRICGVLNDDNVMKKTTTYPNFRHWWNPNYKETCFVKNLS